MNNPLRFLFTYKNFLNAENAKKKTDKKHYKHFLKNFLACLIQLECLDPNLLCKNTVNAW